jgi:large subunit ribosomal protein L13
MKTTTNKPSAPAWHIVDAKGKVLGRLATEIAHVLRGKHKVDWSPHQVHSDHVIVINTKEVSLLGKKPEQKEYIKHSGYFGSLKKIPFSRMIKKNPNHIISHAVKGMLPKNKLRTIMMDHLHLFDSAEHTHEAQQPQELNLKSQKTT